MGYVAITPEAFVCERHQETLINMVAYGKINSRLSPGIPVETFVRADLQLFISVNCLRLDR